MAFSQSGSNRSQDVCVVRVYSSFFESGGKIGACGYLVNEEKPGCGGGFNDELTDKWVAAAEFVLHGAPISRAGFFALNLIGPGQSKATCVVIEKPWSVSYVNVHPRFNGSQVSVTY